MLVLITGLPGTGKSTVANHLARRINARILRTDEVRKRLFAKPKYTEEEKEIVYKGLFLIAENLLRVKSNVVLDGTFYKRSLRKQIYRTATSTRSKLIIVECMASEEAIERRLRRRKKRKRGGLSDADEEVYHKIKKEYESIESEHIVLDTSRPLNETLNELYSSISLSMWSSTKLGRGF
ncbi:MAG: AAA family ATPase [Candidatus Hydrothermarchaeales archaeon]